jgi:hypothetical protein
VVQFELYHYPNAQALAVLPREIFEEVKIGKKSRRQVQRERRRSAVTGAIPQFPPGKYPVNYADPQWKYGDFKEW